MKANMDSMILECIRDSFDKGIGRHKSVSDLAYSWIGLHGVDDAPALVIKALYPDTYENMSESEIYNEIYGAQYE